jgi:hypothetical protein
MSAKLARAALLDAAESLKLVDAPLQAALDNLMDAVQELMDAGDTSGIRALYDMLTDAQDRIRYVGIALAQIQK